MPETDLLILGALKAAAEARVRLAASGPAPEYWELLVAEKDHPGMLANADAVHLGPVLATLRAVHGKVARGLVSLAQVALPGVDPDSVSMLVGFVIISPKGRDAALRWIADPAAHEAEARDRLRGVLATVEAHRAALAAAPAAASSSDSSTVTASAIKLPAHSSEETILELNLKDLYPGGQIPLLPAGVDRDVLDQVKLAETCRGVFQAANLKAETWEILAFVMEDGAEARKKTALLAGIPDVRSPQYRIGAQALFDRLLKVRSAHSRFVLKLRTWLASLAVERNDPEQFEMALGFIIASPKGRERAAQWLDSQDASRPEATTRLTELLTRARRYREALKG